MANNKMANSNITLFNKHNMGAACGGEGGGGVPFNTTKDNSLNQQHSKRKQPTKTIHNIHLGNLHNLPAKQP